MVDPSRVYANDGDANPAFWTVLPVSAHGMVVKAIKDDTAVQVAIRAKLNALGSPIERATIIDLINRSTANCIGQQILGQALNPHSANLSIYNLLAEGTATQIDTVISDAANVDVHNALAARDINTTISVISRQVGRALFQICMTQLDIFGHSVTRIRALLQERELIYASTDSQPKYRVHIPGGQGMQIGDNNQQQNTFGIAVGDEATKVDEGKITLNTKVDRVEAQGRVTGVAVDSIGSEVYDALTGGKHQTTNAFAVARIENYKKGRPFFSGKPYVLLAGIDDQYPRGFNVMPISLPSELDTVQLDVVVHADDMDIQPSWVQPCIYKQSEKSVLVKFILTPITPGLKTIRVEYLYQQHWLTKIEFHVDVKPAPQVGAAPILAE